MKEQEFEVEEVIVDEKNKYIALVRRHREYYILKKFYQHDNIDVYRTLMQYPHRNICQIFSVEEISDGFVVWEEYLGRHTLAEMIPIKSHDFFGNVALQLCDALEHLHKFKIIHRDLKPENIHHVDGAIVLNDFDISKPLVKERLSGKDTRVLGSVGYASPEQHGFSRSDERSDIYSLGVVLNVMNTNALIWEGVADDRLKPIVIKCTEMNPEDRYQTIAEVRTDLEGYKRRISKYTLPGFRTHNPKKMIMAIIGYCLIFGRIMVMESSNATSFFDHLQSKITVAVIILPIIAIATNYLNIRSLIPRSLKRHQIIGSILLWTTIFFSTMFFLAIIWEIIESLLAAYQ